MTKSFILLLSVFFFTISGAQENTTLEQELKKTVASENLTGAVWSTVSNDIITTGAIGLNNVDTKEVLENDDRVLIGSVTKTLIATGILRLSSQGILDIDAPVYKIIPDITFDNPWREDNPVTIRDLLNHTSGIEDSRFWQIFRRKNEQYGFF